MLRRSIPWTRKPPVKAQVNYSHQLAHGLVGCWIDGIDTVRGELEDLSKSGNNAPSESATIVTHGVDKQGRKSVITNTTGNGTGYGYDIGDPAELSAINKEITIIQGVVLRANPGSLGWGRGISKTNGATGDNWGTVFRAGDGGGLDRQLSFRLNGTADGSTQLNAEQYYNLAFQYKTGDKKIWIDSVIDTDVSTTTGDITTTGNVKIGNHGSAADRSLRGDLHYTYIFNRFLSPQEIKALHDNPYQFLQPQARYLPFGAAAAGGPLNQSRMGKVGVGRPYLRTKYPVATPTEQWRMESGNTFGGNALSPAAGGATGKSNPMWGALGGPLYGPIG